MAFSVESKKSGTTYYLHCREPKSKTGRTSKIFFFAKEVKEGCLDELPEGYMVIENELTGLPFLKKKPKD